MNPADLENLLNGFKMMAKLELTLAALYKACAAAWPEERDFWADLEAQEQGHARNIGEMARLVTEHPERYEGHRVFFQPKVLDRMLADLKARIDDVAGGRADPEAVLRFARDTEQSLINARYDEIVKTDDLAFERLVKDIVVANYEIRHQLHTRLAEVQAEKRRRMLEELRPGDLLAELPADLSRETFETLLETGAFRLERIVSRGQATPEGRWLESDTHEWVMVIRGRARLEFEGVDAPVELGPGGHVTIPARRRHRVTWTDPGEPTVWLALHYA